MQQDAQPIEQAEKLLEGSNLFQKSNITARRIWKALWGQFIQYLFLQDECSCVGCKQCMWIAPAVYRIEPEYGRSRVFAQWASPEDDIQVSHCLLTSVFESQILLSFKGQF